MVRLQLSCALIYSKMDYRRFIYGFIIKSELPTTLGFILPLASSVSVLWRIYMWITGNIHSSCDVTFFSAVM
jgi:hypothetical protein